MQRSELRTLVKGLKAEFEKPTQLSRKTIGDRANLANLAALEMLVDTVAEKNHVPFTNKGQSLQNLVKELAEVTGVVNGLGKQCPKN